MSETKPAWERRRPPDYLKQSNNVSAEIIREDLWRPPNLQNDWRMFVIVGREGKGKSLTCAAILRAADPTFNADRIHFEPTPFLEDVAADWDEPGKAIMGDEAGVSFGNRTWHDREQIEANQALQTARDDNNIIGLTLPRLSELDKQLIGRLHALLIVDSVKEGDHAIVRWHRMDPSRTGQDKIYRKKPKKVINEITRKVECVRIGLPPEPLVEAYQEKKDEWKHGEGGLYDRTIERFEKERDETDPKPETPREIMEDIIDKERVSDFAKTANGRALISTDLVALEYDIGDRKARKIKAGLEDRFDIEEYV